MRDYSKITMVNVQKKSIMDYIYSEMAQRFMFVVFLASAFVFGLMYGYGEIESPKVFWLMAIMLIYYIFDPSLKNNPIDLPFLFLCAVTYLIAVWQKMDNPVVSDIYDPTPYAWIMPSVYLLGNLVVGNKKEKLEDRVLWILLVLGIGMYIQGLLNYAVYFIDDVPSQIKDFPYSGVWRSFWNLDVDGTRNNWNNGFFILSGGLFYAVISRHKKRLVSFIIVLATVASVVLNLAFRGRTMPVFVVIVFGTLAFICFIRDDSNQYKRLKRVLFCTAGFAVLVGIVAYVIIANNLFGAGTAFQTSMWVRGGGVFNNVRLKMWRGGIDYMFTLQKGGWTLDETIYGLKTTHNLWLEFGKHYDIIIFFIWIAFLVAVLIKHIGIVVRCEKESTILFFPLGASIVMFLFTMVEPIYILNQDLILYFLFLIGVVNGIGRTSETGDYQLLDKKQTANMNRYYFVGLGLLAFALIANAYQDWWTDRLLISSVVIPIVGYVLGVVVNYKNRATLIIAMSSISAILAIHCFVISFNSEYFIYGFCIDPFTGNVLEKSVLYAYTILPIAILLGIVCYKLKMNKILMTVITVIGTGIILLPQIRDGRLFQMKEALRLQLGMENGAQWIASKNNTTGLITSHSLWLDYARDYGMLTLGLLLLFEIWTMYCFIMLIIKKDRRLEEYILTLAFILFNYQFMFESTAITSRYIFATGIFIHGLICLEVPIVIKLND